jgi:hypothetical protein
VAVLVLCGCTPAAHKAPVARPPKLANLVVAPDGIAGLPVGLPITSYRLVDYGEHTCPTKGGWLPRYSQDLDNSGGQLIDPFDVVTRSGSQSGEITAEYVWSNKIRTARGIRVGSSLAALTAAYPHATRKTSVATVLYVITGTRGKLVIEVAGDQSNPYATGEWPQDRLNTVLWMDVVPKGAEAESIANNDDAGPCPIKGHVPDVDDD